MGGKEDCESRNERDPKRVDSFRATPNSFVCANSHVIRGNGRYRENCQFGRVRCHSGAHPARGGVGRATAASRLAVAALVLATMSDSDAPEYDDGASPDLGGAAGTAGMDPDNPLLARAQLALKKQLLNTQREVDE